MLDFSSYLQISNDRREIIIPGDRKKTIQVCAEHFIHLAQRSIGNKGKFSVALAGGSTPKGIYRKICSSYKGEVDWSKVWLFWSDERAVLPTCRESNYYMAMEAGFKNIGIPSSQIFRMEAEKNIEKNAIHYQKKIEKYLGPSLFDLVILGLGEDGHVASLFPKNIALSIQDRLVSANFVEQKNSWRMTLTFKCINNSSNIVVYVLGSGKSKIVKDIVISPPLLFPAQMVGSKNKKALWFVDTKAAKDAFNL